MSLLSIGRTEGQPTCQPGVGRGKFRLSEIVDPGLPGFERAFRERNAASRFRDGRGERRSNLPEIVRHDA